MAITIPTSFVPIDTQEIGTSRPIDDTEATLAKNAHYLYARHRPTLIRCPFRGSGGVGPYVVGEAASSNTIHGLWCIEPPGAMFSNYKIYVLASNSSSTAAGEVKFELSSNSASVSIAVAAGSPEWTSLTGTLAINNTVSTDTIRMFAINGSTGSVKVHHVMVLPEALTSVASAPSVQNGNVFVPTDDSEITQDAPLSVRLRGRVYGNMYTTWRNRPGSCVSFSEDAEYRTTFNAFTTTAAEYEEVARFPIFVPRDVTAVRWAVFSVKSGTGTGKVRLRTASMDAFGTAAIEIDAVQSYTSPYTGNLAKYDDGGYTTLTVTPSGAETTQDEIIVDIISDGSSRVDLLGLTAWFEAADAT